MDRVEHQDHTLLITSRNNYPWDIRSYRKWCVVVDEKRYWLAQKNKTREGYQYLLKLWAEHDSDIPGDVFHYDQDYAAHFQSSMRKFRAKKGTGLFLAPFQPLIGLLWSNSKSFLEEKFGVDSYQATEWALRFQVLFIVLCGIFILIDIVVGGHLGIMLGISKKVIVPMSFVVILDSIYKYDGIQREERPLFGFFEWLYWILFKSKG